MAREAYLHDHFGYGARRPSRLRLRLAELVLAVVPGGCDTAASSVCFLPAPDGHARFLEVGFGDGFQLAAMRDRAWDVEGVDADSGAVRAAGARGLKVRAGSLPEQGFTEAQFDAIYMSHVVEHVHDPVALLCEAARVLKPGGRLVVLTPNVDALGHRRFGKDWFALDVPRHLLLFTPRRLAELAWSADLEVTTLRTSSRLMTTIWALSKEIEQCGRVLSVGQYPSARLVLQGLLAQYVEAARMRRQPHAGEEIILIATRASRR
jgi:SAM-dependent methyltransferase